MTERVVTRMDSLPQIIVIVAWFEKSLIEGVAKSSEYM